MRFKIGEHVSFQQYNNDNQQVIGTGFIQNIVINEDGESYDIKLTGPFHINDAFYEKDEIYRDVYDINIRCYINQSRPTEDLEYRNLIV
jgi:hypothetical protein